MRAVTRGAILLSLLPTWPKHVTATRLAYRLRAYGATVGVRTLQRDLESMPPELVGCVTDSKPFRWFRRES